MYNNIFIFKRDLAKLFKHLQTKNKEVNIIFHSFTNLYIEAFGEK